MTHNINIIEYYIYFEICFFHEEWEIKTNNSIEVACIVHPWVFHKYCHKLHCKIIKENYSSSHNKIKRKIDEKLYICSVIPIQFLSTQNSI